MIRRITSYLYGTIDTVRKLLGLSEMGFAVSPKVSDEDESKRYEQGIMEFGASTPEYVIIATVALLNLVCLVGGLCKILTSGENMAWSGFFLQVVLCGLLVIINIPVYEAVHQEGHREHAILSNASVHWLCDVSPPRAIILRSQKWHK